MGINSIGQSYLDDIAINLKASPNGVCGKGIPLNIMTQLEGISIVPAHLIPQ